MQVVCSWYSGCVSCDVQFGVVSVGVSLRPCACAMLVVRAFLDPFVWVLASMGAVFFLLTVLLLHLSVVSPFLLAAERCSAS